MRSIDISRAFIWLAACCLFGMAVPYPIIADDDFHQTKKVNVVTPEPTWTSEQKGPLVIPAREISDSTQS